MTRVYEGWSEMQLYTLLQLFRTHVIEYIYGGDGLFAASAHAQLPDKSETNIVETMRALMSQFSLAIDTKAFRNEGDICYNIMAGYIVYRAHDRHACVLLLLVLNVDGQSIEVHVHLYETTANMLENKSGGVWHPDLLVRLLKKIKQYLGLLQRRPDIFFSRLQLWSRSVAETRSKFYALRDLYEKEKNAVRKQPRTDIEETRFSALEELFQNVPSAPRVKDPTIFDKIPKLWSPDDLDMLIQFLVQITLDIQKEGTSELVATVSTRLHRTEQSVVNKLRDMRKNFLTKSSYPRAAHIPDVIFDSDSVAHKIFNADWSNPTDPYALGFRAIKSNFNAAISRRTRARNAVALAPSTRKKRRTQEQNETTSNATSAQFSSRRATSSSTSRQPVVSGFTTEVQYTDFVREMALKYKWSERKTHGICAGMDQFMDLYRGKKLKAFFEAIAQTIPGLKVTGIYFNGQTMLKTFETRFGGLDKFGEIALGEKTEATIVPAVASAAAAAIQDQNQGGDVESRPEEEPVSGEGAEVDTGVEEPNVSPSGLADSPLSVSEPENDDSSLEDENPIDVDDDEDDEIDTISIDSSDHEACSPPDSMSAFKPRKTYPSGKSYGKSDEIMSKVKAACESCTIKKKKRHSLRKHSSDSNESDDDGDEDTDGEQTETGVDNSGWNSLFRTMDVRISQLKDRNRELIERKEDRDRHQKRVKWRRGIRIEVRSIQEVSTSL